MGRADRGPSAPQPPPNRPREDPVRPPGAGRGGPEAATASSRGLEPHCWRSDRAQGPGPPKGALEILENPPLFSTKRLPTPSPLPLPPPNPVLTRPLGTRRGARPDGAAMAGSKAQKRAGAPPSGPGTGQPTGSAGTGAQPHPVKRPRAVADPGLGLGLTPPPSDALGAAGANAPAVR